MAGNQQNTMSSWPDDRSLQSSAVSIKSGCLQELVLSVGLLIDNLRVQYDPARATMASLYEDGNCPAVPDVPGVPDEY